jgi:cell division protein FtsI/penicillin-binding protein 2
MTMTKNKVIIILSGLLLACLVIVFFIFFLQKKHETDLTKKNDEIVKNLNQIILDRDKKIKEIIDNPKIKIIYKTETIETLKIMPDEEKNKLVLNLQDQNKELRKTIDDLNLIIKSDTTIIDSLKKSLFETNNILKSKKEKLNDISIFGLAGLDKNLNIDIYAGLIYKRTLYYNNYFSFAFGGGGAVKVYKDLGGSIILEGSIKFGSFK